MLSQKRADALASLCSLRVQEWVCIVFPFLITFVLCPTDFNFVASAEVARMMQKQFVERAVATITCSLLSAGFNVPQLLVLTVLGSIVSLARAGPEFDIPTRRVTVVGVVCLLLGAAA